MAEEGASACASASSTDNELKARLVAAFCPALRFDAAERHFPVSVESFFSSSLLLRTGTARKQRRRPRPPRGNPRRLLHGGTVSSSSSSSGGGGSGGSDDGGGGGSGGGGGGGGGCGGGRGGGEGGGGGGDGGSGGSGRARSRANGGEAHAWTAEGEINHSRSRNESRQGRVRGGAQEQGQGGQGTQGQACGECGSRQGWRVPASKGWTVIPLPPGCDRWGTAELLQEQRRSNRFKFRLEPHSCLWEGQEDNLSAVPCYGFAEALDMSVVAPFIRRSGLGPIYEIKYAFLYGYNGTTFAVPGTSVGVHTGDLEHVTIRVDAARMMILEAFFAAHSTGEGKWVPSREFYRQVQALEATAYPGVAAEVPESAREFLETESATAFEGRDTNARQDPHVTPEACLGVGGALDGVIERLVVYPARNGHASYHMPKRWRRFVGLGDDVCGGDGRVWRPSPVQLDHPEGNSPAWLQFRGRFGATGCIPSEGFWNSQGEPLRRCSAEAKYRSLLEEGLVPDRGVRIGAARRMLHGNGDQGVWLERCRQTENRLPFFNTWTKVPGVSSGKPRNQDPPRAAGRMWLHDWAFLRDLEGGSTDAKGWSYHVLADRYADTGVTGEAQANGLNAHRARGRVWFRVAATPRTALEVEEAYRRNGGRYPRTLLGLAALDVSGRGDTVTAESILQTLQGNICNTTTSRRNNSGGASRRRRTNSNGVLTARQGGLGGTPNESLASFGDVARLNLGLS